LLLLFFFGGEGMRKKVNMKVVVQMSDSGAHEKNRGRLQGVKKEEKETQFVVTPPLHHPPSTFGLISPIPLCFLLLLLLPFPFPFPFPFLLIKKNLSS